ncbi:hypothetical protein CBM2634_U20043 [Cupriavidus taiwanensis]|uniref:Uncharacterized protein n=1 Tax=Cupriavidus taiwanensis TaxID=164546 RepID=A0A375JBZ8_9BURK|nr:hypothetical protein CBM2634_U20043 [Cupriavidus taiwanensis]
MGLMSEVSKTHIGASWRVCGDTPVLVHQVAVARTDEHAQDYFSESGVFLVSFPLLADSRVQ